MTQKKTRSSRANRSDDEVFTKAVGNFEKAVKAVYKGDHQKALEIFEALVEANPTESELVDRTRSYIAVCQRKLSPTKRPKTAEEVINQALIHHNDGEIDQALKLYNKALELEPKNGNIHYYLAAAHARSGDAANSARHLEQAIEADPINEILAKSDDDFSTIRSGSSIEEIVAPSETA